MTSTPIAEISRGDLRKLRSPLLASITDVKHLASYNWIEATTPTIAVPGSPGLWSPPPTIRRLKTKKEKKRSGLTCINQNATRRWDSRLEPLFRALYITNPAFDIRSTDIVTDRNSIRELLSFTNHRPSKKEAKEFTINIEVAKNTVMFSRAIQEDIQPRDIKRFVERFEKKYTTAQLEDSTGHHRIISYRFGDLNFIVRHQTNAYVDTGPEAPSSSSSSSGSKAPEKDIPSSVPSSLTRSPSSNSSPPNSTTPTDSKLTIQQEGNVIPLASTLEIKKRGKRRSPEEKDLIPPLWVSQTPKLVRAYPVKVRFEAPEVEDMTTAIKLWQGGNQTYLRKLAVLIRWIIDVVKGSEGSFVIKYEGMGDKVVVSKVEGVGKMLPMDLYSKWDGEDDAEVETGVKDDAEAEKGAEKSVGEAESKV